MDQISDKRKLAIYSRVSTLNLGQDPMLQTIQLREFAKNRGFEIVAEFTDRMSGMKAKRPALQAMLKQARLGKFNVIAVTALDRLGRSSIGILLLMNELTELGISVISLRENLDATTSSGRALIGMLAIINNLERDIISARVKEGIQAKRLLAAATGVPWSIGRPLSLTEKMIGDITALRAQGVSLRKIAKELGVSKSSVLRVVGSKTSQSYKNNLSSNPQVRSNANEETK